MSCKPILFSSPMVNALLAGKKAQTRRILKEQPELFVVDDKGTLCDVYPVHSEDEAVPRVALGHNGSGVITTQKLAYAKGDKLWVREGLTADSNDQGKKWITYSADGRLPEGGKIEWRYKRDVIPSMFMPRWASRITLEVTDVRIERLQNISAKDAIAEGIEKTGRFDEQVWKNYDKANFCADGFLFPINSYMTLWNSLNGARAWDHNPWVAAYTFIVLKRDIHEASE